MTPVPCIAPRHEEGDCWRACLASILNLCANDVPNFVHEHKDWVAATREWLAERGLGLFQTYCDAQWELDAILKWMSGGDPPDAHAVVIMDGKIVHDPSNSGLSGPVEVSCDCCRPRWYLYMVAFADLSRFAE